MLRMVVVLKERGMTTCERARLNIRELRIVVLSLISTTFMLEAHGMWVQSTVFNVWRRQQRTAQAEEKKQSRQHAEFLGACTLRQNAKGGP